MENLRPGDIVARKSHGNDISFKIIDVMQTRANKPIYVLQGVLYRIIADSYGDDLIKQDENKIRLDTSSFLDSAKQRAYAGKKTTHRRVRKSLLQMMMSNRSRPGKVLHIDSSEEFLNMCVKHYRDAGVSVVSQQAAESEQPNYVRPLLEKYKPDILVVTGHDGIKKNCSKYSLDCYRNSSYFVQSVNEARSYESNPDKLAIFAGACQSYFEAIMNAGANFASAPQRVFINALDPAIVSEKIALTDTKTFVTPDEIAEITISGSDGIGGKDTRGRNVRL